MVALWSQILKKERGDTDDDRVMNAIKELELKFDHADEDSNNPSDTPCGRIFEHDLCAVTWLTRHTLWLMRGQHAKFHRNCDFRRGGNIQLDMVRLRYERGVDLLGIRQKCYKFVIEHERMCVLGILFGTIHSEIIWR